MLYLNCHTCTLHLDCKVRVKYAFVEAYRGVYNAAYRDCGNISLFGRNGGLTLYSTLFYFTWFVLCYVLMVVLQLLFRANKRLCAHNPWRYDNIQHLCTHTQLLLKHTPRLFRVDV